MEIVLYRFAFEIEKLKNEDLWDFFERFDTVQNLESFASEVVVPTTVSVDRGGQSGVERIFSESCQGWTLKS